jgi:hypothetical protein
LSEANREVCLPRTQIHDAIVTDNLQFKPGIAASKSMYSGYQPFLCDRLWQRESQSTIDTCVLETFGCAFNHVQCPCYFIPITLPGLGDLYSTRQTPKKRDAKHLFEFFNAVTYCSSGNVQFCACPSKTAVPRGSFECSQSVQGR